MYKTNPSKATVRDFLNAVIAGTVDDEAIDFAKSELAKLDARNAKRAATPSKTALANAPIKDAIFNYIKSNNGAVCADIASACGVTVQKASALCVQMVKEGHLTAEEVKIPKKGKVKAYSVV